LFYAAAQRGDRDRVPDLKQDGFCPIGQPIKFRVTVFDGDDGVLRANQRAFFDRFNSQRQDSAVFCVQTFPAFVVEAFRISREMFGSEFPRLFDIVGGKNLSSEVRFYDVLEAGDLHVIEKAAARANVGINETRVWRILPPVGELVAIGIENRVKSKGLDRDLPILGGSSCWLAPQRSCETSLWPGHGWSSVKATYRRRWSR